MIHVQCQCGQRVAYNNPSGGAATKCPACKAVLRPVTGNALPLDGSERFDARLTMTAGLPQRVGEQIVLGGAGPIEVGKLPSKSIFLPGQQVSRNHCRLGRTVSGWQIQDTQSTNGIFVNGAKAQQSALRDGDRVRVGDFEFAFTTFEARPAAARAMQPGTLATAKAPVASVAAPARGAGARPLPTPPIPAVATAMAVPAPVARQAAPIDDEGLIGLQDEGEDLLRLADEPPTVAPPVPPRSSAPVGRSVVPARAALPPIEHADVPAASDEESFDLYDLADDAAGKVAHAEAEPIAELPPVSRTSLKPAAAPMARAGPAGGAGAMRTTKSGAVLVGGRRPLNYASAADGDGQRTLGEADIDWVMRLRNASTLMVWTININFLATWFTFGIDMLEGGAAMAVAVMNVAASWLLTCREPEAHESVGWTIVRVALRAFASLTFVGEVSIAIGTFGIANPLGAWGYLLMGATIPATALFLLYLWKLATRIPNKPLAVNVLIVMIGLTGVLIGTVGGVAFGAASGSAGTAIFAGIAGIVLLIVFRIWYLGLLIWFNRSFS